MNKNIIAKTRLRGVILGHLFLRSILILSIGFSLGIGSLFGQTVNSDNGPAVENVELNKLLEYILAVQKYGPRTFEKEFIRTDFEEKIFKGLQESLDIIDRNMESSYQTLNYYRDVLIQENQLSGYHHYRLSFGFDINFYNVLHKFAKVRFNYYFDKNINYLHQVERVLDDNGDILIASLGSEAIYPLFYKAKHALASILMFKGMEMYNQEARQRFEYLLGKNRFKTDFIPDQESRMQIYYNMLEIYDRLLYVNYDIHTDYLKMIAYNREKLSYLWKIVDINHDNQKVKDVKFRRLYTTYAPIMNPESDNYKNLYSKYREEWDTLPVLYKAEVSQADVEENPAAQPNQAAPADQGAATQDAGTPAAPDPGAGQ